MIISFLCLINCYRIYHSKFEINQTILSCLNCYIPVHTLVSDFMIINMVIYILIIEEYVTARQAHSFTVTTTKILVIE